MMMMTVGMATAKMAVGMAGNMAAAGTVRNQMEHSANEQVENDTNARGQHHLCEKGEDQINGIRFFLSQRWFLFASKLWFLFGIRLIMPQNGL
jgi:hypothetical protein